ncbi:hypothetical protein [Phytoactinopolyspora halotolerans]|uniref:Uncharacterized protein n=1 Tax=Phytoactinopolyspora halotolerans TaxID=1981512 RepID=A0A6L9SF49_9ACTN|nr:hypothetical protein [Phytoactinopolyspora halotolerans]NEE03846.1 hypothetical protein [Phytoactinopolyspora halotolerans]
MSRISVTTLDDRISDTIKLDALQQRLVSDLIAWDGGRFDPECRRQRDAASEAVETIDTMRRKLDQLRTELVTEIRRYDDESARRTDELLARVRAERNARVPR